MSVAYTSERENLPVSHFHLKNSITSDQPALHLLKKLVHITSDDATSEIKFDRDCGIDVLARHNSLYHRDLAKLSANVYKKLDAFFADFGGEGTGDWRTFSVKFNLHTNVIHPLHLVLFTYRSKYDASPVTTKMEPSSLAENWKASVERWIDNGLALREALTMFGSDESIKKLLSVYGLTQASDYDRKLMSDLCQAVIKLLPSVASFEGKARMKELLQSISSKYYSTYSANSGPFVHCARSITFIYTIMLRSSTVKKEATDYERWECLNTSAALESALSLIITVDNVICGRGKTILDIEACYNNYVKTCDELEAQGLASLDLMPLAQVVSRVPQPFLSRSLALLRLCNMLADLYERKEYYDVRELRSSVGATIELAISAVQDAAAIGPVKNIKEISDSISSSISVKFREVVERDKAVLRKILSRSWDIEATHEKVYLDACRRDDKIAEMWTERLKSNDLFCACE